MAEQSEDEETEGLNDESSGYVIDYEQVLKDNSAVRRSPSPITPSDPIEDHFTMGQENDVILEQTNEAIEDDSSDETPRQRSSQRKRQSSSKRKVRSHKKYESLSDSSQDSP